MVIFHSYVSLPEGIFVVSEKIAQFWGGDITYDTRARHLRHRTESLAHTIALRTDDWVGVGWGDVHIHLHILLYNIYIYIIYIYIDTYIHMQGKVSDLEQVQKTTPAKPNPPSA